MPRPLQSELPIWVTAAGNPQTFRRAGAIGAHLLTHLLGQTLESLGRKVAAYRAAWEAAGHPGRGTVSLMLHTFVGEDDAEVRRQVTAPMLRYLGSSAHLVGGYTTSVPFFQQRCARIDGELTQADLEAALEFSFEKYYQTSSLLGTMDACLDMTDRIRENDIDEVACLIDFGVGVDEVLDALPLLDELRELANLPPAPVEVQRPLG
jgi:natural product biosynthesis luciferase-like monooxygenase protein